MPASRIALRCDRIYLHHRRLGERTGGSLAFVPVSARCVTGRKKTADVRAAFVRARAYVRGEQHHIAADCGMHLDRPVLLGTCRPRFFWRSWPDSSIHPCGRIWAVPLKAPSREPPE